VENFQNFFSFESFNIPNYFGNKNQGLNLFNPNTN
jgi:hypothetical protein